MNLNIAIALSMVVFFVIFAIYGYLLIGGIIKPKRWHGAILIVLYMLFVFIEYAANLM